MSVLYTGINGEQYLCNDEPLGKGGEGSVYEITTKPDFVIKVFNEQNRTETRHRKLLAMAGTKISANMMKQIVWPVDVVYLNRRFVGYVMPKLDDFLELNCMYIDDSGYTLYDKIMIARNLCAAISAVHNAGQVCGDLNPKNIIVDPASARVTLVDTDSYHITDRANSRVYRCEVGLPEYLPREIQEKMRNGYDLRTAPLPTFTRETDLFALAVHIFALLMNGCHPFASAVDYTAAMNAMSVSRASIVAPQPVDNVCNGLFVFHEGKNGLVKPKYAPDFEILPPKIQEYFIRTFVDGHTDPSKRVDTLEWYDALSTMLDELQVCKENQYHMYAAHLDYCPWCKLEKILNIYIAKPKPVKTQMKSVHEIRQKAVLEDYNKRPAWYKELFDTIVYSMTYIPGVSKVMNKVGEGIAGASEKAKDMSETFFNKNTDNPKEKDKQIDDEEFSVHRIDYEKRGSMTNPYANMNNAASAGGSIHSSKASGKSSHKNGITPNGNSRAKFYNSDKTENDADRYVQKDEMSVEEKAYFIMDKILDFFEYINNKVIYWRTTLIAAFVIQLVLHFIDEEHKFHSIVFSLCGMLSATGYNASLLRKGKKLEYRFRDYFYSVGLSIAGRYIGTFLLVAFLSIFGVVILKK